MPIHKKLLAGVGGFLAGGPVGAAAALVSTFRSGRDPCRPGERFDGSRCLPAPSARSLTARPSARSFAEKERGRGLKFAEDTRTSLTAGGRCGFGFVRDQFGNCVRRGSELLDPFGLFGGPAVPTPGAPVGDAIMGRYGAALAPGSRIIDRAVCLRGMQLGDDGLCYNKGQIRNNQRMWPAGRKPLLTGGDMRAISTAARAGRRLELASKRLQKIGLMKKPPPRRKFISGPTEHHHHGGS